MKTFFQTTGYRSKRLIQILLVLYISAGAQTFNLTGTIVDSVNSQGIANALVKIIEVPKCTTKTSANGSFTLSYTSGISMSPISSYDSKEITLKGNALFITGVQPSTQILVEIYNCQGSRTRYFQMASGPNSTIACSDLWKTSGWYLIKVRMEGKDYSISGIGMNRSFFPGMQNDRASFLSGDEQKRGLAKASAGYTLSVSATGYVIKQISITVTTGSQGTIRLVKPPKVNTGTGTNYPASYATTVTGGGAMPDIATGYSCSCDGTGATDASACLQTAANTARTQSKPLLIPATTGFYKITRAITIYGSVIGTGGMPTIKQTATGGNNSCAGLMLAANMTGWIYNLHIIGSYGAGGGGGEWAPNIGINQANGVTIRGCLLENPMGDNIFDCQSKPVGSRNVLIDGNTLVNPYRCSVALTGIADRWVIINNIANKPNTNGSAFDWEPNEEASYITNIELAYNKVSSVFYPTTNVNGWFDSTPGKDIFVHHNYGSWPAGKPFAVVSTYMSGGVKWTNVVNTKNVMGNSVPQ